MSVQLCETHALPSENSRETLFSNTNQVAFAGMETIFETMKFADITLYVRDWQFRAHKIILATRSPFFAAMFQHQTEDILLERVQIEDVEPAVFEEILHFIYTGRLSKSEMKSTMPFEILKVAGKYLIDQLKLECETQLIHRITADNCVQLLCFTEENDPAFYLKKHAIQFFRNFSSEVMAT
jgi:speckle-type POZ protein